MTHPVATLQSPAEFGSRSATSNGFAPGVGFFAAVPNRILGYEPTGGTPTELAATAAADVARWGPVIRAVDFRGE